MTKKSPDPNNDKAKSDTLPKRSRGCGKCDEGWTDDGKKWVPCPNCP